MGYLTLAIGMINYAFSIYFIVQYMGYSQTVEDNNFDIDECEVNSAFVILSYCSLFQVTLGTIACLTFITSFLLKGCHAISFAFPITAAKFKKTWHGIPRDFAHY